MFTPLLLLHKIINYKELIIFIIASNIFVVLLISLVFLLAGLIMYLEEKFTEN